MSNKFPYIILGLVVITAILLSLKTEMSIHFTNPPNPDFVESTNPIRVDEQEKPISFDDCKISGCSGQICSDEDVMTTCEYKDEYACYKTAKCERQEDSRCGWTPTEELVACLGTAFQTEVESQ